MAVSQIMSSCANWFLHTRGLQMSQREPCTHHLPCYRVGLPPGPATWPGTPTSCCPPPGWLLDVSGPESQACCPHLAWPWAVCGAVCASALWFMCICARRGVGFRGSKVCLQVSLRVLVHMCGDPGGPGRCVSVGGARACLCGRVTHVPGCACRPWCVCICQCDCAWSTCMWRVHACWQKLVCVECVWCLGVHVHICTWGGCVCPCVGCKRVCL